MRVTEVRFQRVKNLGNYETERCELVATVDEGEQHQDVLQTLRNEAKAFLFGEDNDLDQGMYN